MPDPIAHARLICLSVQQNRGARLSINASNPVQCRENTAASPAGWPAKIKPHSVVFDHVPTAANNVRIAVAVVAPGAADPGLTTMVVAVLGDLVAAPVAIIAGLTSAIVVSGVP